MIVFTTRGAVDAGAPIGRGVRAGLEAALHKGVARTFIAGITTKGARSRGRHRDTVHCGPDDLHNGHHDCRAVRDKADVRAIKNWLFGGAGFAEWRRHLANDESKRTRCRWN